MSCLNFFSRKFKQGYSVNVPKIKMHMKMIEHTHFICHFYSPIPVISHTILPYKT